VENRKTKQLTCSEVSVNSPGNACPEVLKKKRKATMGKVLQKRKVLSLKE